MYTDQIKTNLIFENIFFIEEQSFGPWFEHVNEFWEIRDEENLLFLFYEDLLKVNNIYTELQIQVYLFFRATLTIKNPSHEN